MEDEVIMVKGKQKVRKAKTSAGNLMLSWRKLRDEGDEETKALFEEVEDVDEDIFGDTDIPVELPLDVDEAVEEGGDEQMDTS